MRAVGKLFSAILFTMLLFPLDPITAAPIIINSDTNSYQISPKLEILLDEHQSYTIEEVISGVYDDEFFSFKWDVPSFGYTDAAYWARLTLENTTSENLWYLKISYPPLDTIRLYSPKEDGSYSIRETGDLFPFSTREIFHRDFVFPLDLKEGANETYYIQIITEGSMQIPVTLFNEDAFQKSNLLEYLILGLYYGFGLIMIIYNVFLYFSLRMSSYLWYTLLILFILLTHFVLNGLAYQYFWPEASWWNNRAILFFMVCSNITVMFFAKSFLNMDIFQPRMNKMLNWSISLQFLLLLILFIRYDLALNLIMVIIIISIILVLSITISSWVKGNQPAKYFFFGWIAFFIGIALSSLSDMGLIPITFFTKYASQMGSGLEIALFSLALAAKIKWLRLEKEALEKQVIKSQQLAVRHLEQANRLKDEFLANTSHELRTPLQGIIGIAEQIRDEKAVDENYEKDIELIITSGKRLSHLINDLLDASKLKYGQMNLAITPINLWNLAEVVCRISEATYQKPITIENLIPEDLPPVAADEIRLQQIFYNLISNAIKYTYRGEIVLTAELAQQYVLVSVRDTGIGISEKDLDQIFDHFKRGENIEDSIHGTGIGLYITKKLVELHGGDISISSAINKGTTVSFTIPVAKPFQQEVIDETEIIKEIQSPDPSKDAVHSLTKVHGNNQIYIGKILLVEDEPVNVHVLTHHLNAAGFFVINAYDGDEALKILTKDSFDLVILDVMLPKLSGIEVTQKIRKNFTLGELPILMLTAKSQAEDIVAAFQAGANDYLIKPCGKEELLARTKTLVTLKQAIGEIASLNENLEMQVEQRTKELSKRTEQLKQINTSRKQLMTNISHELGTPMTTVKGYIKAILDGVIDGNDKKYIALVYQKILMIERLIQDLYELARLESKQIHFSWRSMAISDFINQCILPFEIEVEKYGRLFKFVNLLSSKEQNYEIVIDIERMKQVLQNLINNAIRFTNEGDRISIKLEFSEEKMNKKINSEQNALFLEVKVCDTGIGMQKEVVENIFERFYQAKKSTDRNGMNSGLGLTIAKEIIRYHRGKIWAESEYGKGSCFHFLIPLHKK